MEEIRTVCVTLRIEYSCPEGMDYGTSSAIAERLGINSDYQSCEDGVRLEEVEFVDEWDE
jgi:hypothetical protein